MPMPAKPPEFAYEKDLVAVLKPSMERLLKIHRCPASRARSGTMVLQEIAVGMRIPDLVLIANQSPHNSRAPLRGFTLMESWIAFELYREGPRTERTLSQSLYSREAIVSAALRKMQKEGAVKKIASGEFQIETDAFPGNSVVIAVEAKLRAWKEALEQAEAYLSFSNYSYIALPSQMATANNRIAEACICSGIGLISVSPKSPRIIVPARYNSEMAPDWVWLLSRAAGLTPT